MDGGSPAGELRLFGQGLRIQDVGAADNPGLVGGGNRGPFRSTAMEEPAGFPGVIRFGVFEADLRSGELRRQGARSPSRSSPSRFSFCSSSARAKS